LIMDRITVVTDSREQLPYIFDPAKVATIRKALPAGDYSLAGLEDRVAVERKSLADFVTTVIRGRKRFHRELQKLSAFEAACVVVECNFRDLVDGRYRSDAHPHAIIATIASIVVDFGVPVYFCSDRQAACRFVEEYLTRFHRRIAKCQSKPKPRRDSGEE
jgi:DNA excision repair protein ERCC-4